MPEYTLRFLLLKDRFQYMSMLPFKPWVDLLAFFLPLTPHSTEGEVLRLLVSNSRAQQLDFADWAISCPSVLYRRLAVSGQSHF
ncbi:hypothetical protein GGR55DRAFT_657541 [Xylaria sp. FL0064]|nr:hypothetical protein GGR55DRAFT_657541 [Xylaria sp. FL0064]